MSPHPHHINMLQYACDAAETDEPYRRWQSRKRETHESGMTFTSVWKDLTGMPQWTRGMEYRRKPDTNLPKLWTKILRADSQPFDPYLQGEFIRRKQQ